MPNIDQLSIEIEANADKATKAIANLTSHLNGLSLALNRINTNSISKFAKSVESLARTGKMVDDTTRNLEHMADTIANKFGVKSKAGLNAIKDGLNDLAQVSKNFRANPTDQLWESVQTAQNGLVETIKTYSTFKNKVEDTSKALRDFINVSAKSGTKISLVNVADDLGENLSHFQKVLGRGFTSTLDSTTQGVKDLEEWLGELDKEFGTGYSNMALDKAISELVGTLENAKTNSISFEESLYHQKQAEADAKATVKDYTDAILELTKIENNVQSSGIADLINSLRGLSEVSVPDFSSFADAISTLNRVNVDKVVNNLDKIRESLANGVDLSAELSKNLANSGLDTMASNMAESMPAAVDGLSSITGMKNELMVIPNVIQSIGDNITKAFNNSSIDNFVRNLYQVTEIVPYVANSLTVIAAKTTEAASTAIAIVDRMNELASATTLESGFIDEMTARMWAFEEAVSSAAKKMIGTTAFTMDSKIIDADFREVPNTVNNATDSIKRLTGAVAEDGEAFDDTIRILDNVKGKFEPLKTTASDLTIKFRGLADTLKGLGTRIAAVSAVFASVSGKLGHIGDIGIKGLKGLYSTSFKILKNFGELLVDNFKEETAKVSELFKNMRSNVTKQLTKMSAFWKRTMRTFTFMLVRKAITAIITNIKEAIDELALFEKEMGKLSKGQFNKSLSEITADFHYIGRAIVAAFEPLINFVVPILNKVAEAVAHIMSIVGEFLAALTGQSYFVTAKKSVVDYGDSLDKNNKKLKEQKKLLLGIDELNVLPKDNDTSSNTGSGVNYKDAFDEKPVSDKMKALAEKIRGILKDLFEPLKKAWDNAKEYLFNGFRYMTNELGKLGKSMWRDFITVWKQPETVKIFENLLRIIGDIEFVVGNLAKKFRQAWDAITDDGKTRGQSIFEGIRDIIGILVQHLRNVTKYMKEWSNSINFKPLLEGFDNLLKKLKPVADFLGGVFEDVMRNIVLEHIRYLIEEALPHLMHVIDEVIDAFDFEKLRTQLQPIEKAFEKMRQNIHEGLVNAMGNLGKAVGEWTQTKNFQAFLDAIERFMGKITPERVEKLFTGLGMGILKVVEGLADFVASPEFEKFIDDILAWFDSLSVDDIANFFAGLAEGIAKVAKAVIDFVTSDQFQWFIGIIVNWFKNTDAEKMAQQLGFIASAIMAFKFTSFVGAGLAGFLKFLTAISTAKNLGTIGKALEGVGKGAAAAGKGAAAAGTGTATAATSLGGVAALAAGATADLTLVAADFKNIKDAADGYVEAQNAHNNEVKTALDNLKRIYEKQGGEVAAQWAKNVYDIDITGKSLGEAQNELERQIDKQWEGIPQNMYDGFKQGWDHYFGENGEGLGQLALDGVSQLVSTIKEFLGIASPSKVMADIGLNVVEGLKNGINENWNQLLVDVGGLINTFVKTVVDGVKGFKEEAVKDFEGFKESVTQNTKDAMNNAITNIKDMKEKTLDKIKEIPSNASKKFEELKRNTNTKFTEVRDKIRDKMKESVDKVKEKLDNMKQKFEKFDLSRVATNIIRGFINGLRSAWVGVTTWANEALGNLKKKFQDGLKIHSPSKVFMEYGEFVVKGFNEGIANFSKSTESTVDKWVSDFSNVEVSISPTVVNPINHSGVIFEGFAEEDNTSSGLSKTDLSDVLTQFAEKYLTNNNRDVKVTLEMDGRKFYEEIVRQDKAQLMRTGRSSFAH